jgi:CRP-like cAMP-binding protein
MSIPSPTRNLVISRLPASERALVAPALEAIELGRDDVLFAAGAKMDRVYFPATCVVALVVELPDGRSIECGTVGYEGVAGVGGVLAGELSFALQRVQVAGAAHSMRRKAFLKAQETCPRLRTLVSTYHDAFVAQLLQSTACLAAHRAEERLARWLLELVDRTDDPELTLTHDVLALMVGASRPTVTLLLGSFEEARLIRARRGRIAIIDRPGLERVSCACYEQTREVYKRVGLLPNGHRPQ